MNKIELLQDLKKDIQFLKYEDVNDIDRLQRKSNMLIRNIFGKDSSYLNDFTNISFCSLYGQEVPNAESYALDWKTDKARVINLIETMVDNISIFPEDSKEETSIQNKLKVDKNKVFVVHGHDETAKTEVARFVEQLGLEAIILHEQANSGSTIIEKLEKHTDVGFAIVLYTACDIGGAKSEPNNPKLRARQNVVFEHGLLIGKIGRENVVALVKEDVETPGDISGMVYETMDIGKAWKFKLGLELKESGYNVDMNKIKL